MPAAYGGSGLDLVAMTRLWIELAAVDANLPQAFRGHFALVEDRLWHHARSSDQRVWFDRFVAGEMAGNAWSEVGSSIDLPRTVLRPRADGSYRLDGTKYYTTGTIFAEWTDVHARVARPGHPDEIEEATAIALVSTRDAGVRTTDDWNGFGQRGTGSGATTFDNVGVPADHVLPFEKRFPYQTAFYQLNLLATLTGRGPLGQGRPQAGPPGRCLDRAIFAFPAAWLVQTENRWAISLVFVVGLGLIYGVVYGPLAAFWSELFDTRYRYTALSTLYQVSGILASGLTPLIAPWLVTRGDGTLWWVAAYNVVVAAISLVCARFLPETRGRGLGRADGAAELEPREPVAV